MKETKMIFDATVDGVNEARCNVAGTICNDIDSVHGNCCSSEYEKCSVRCPILGSIDLALDEICTNILDHSHTGKSKFNVILQVETEKKSVNIIVSDCYIPKFSKKTVRDVSNKYLENGKNGNDDRGRGLLTVNSVVDTMSIYKVSKSARNKKGGLIVDFSKDLTKGCKSSEQKRKKK